MSFLAKNQMGRMVDWAEKHKLAEKYFNEISLIGACFW
jgi:hypothetical protein